MRFCFDKVKKVLVRTQDSVMTESGSNIGPPDGTSDLHLHYSPSLTRRGKSSEQTSSTFPTGFSSHLLEVPVSTSV